MAPEPIDIICVGDLSIDSYTNLNCWGVGGCSYNVFYHLQHVQRLVPQLRPQLWAALGDDLWAQKIEEELRGQAWRPFPFSGKSPFQHIELYADGEKNFTGYEAGVLNQFELKAGDVLSLRKAAAVVCVFYQEILPLIESLQRLPQVEQLPLAIDLMHLRDFPWESPITQWALAHARWILIGPDPVMFEQLRERLSVHARQHPEQLVLVTLAEKGCWSLQAGEWQWHPCPEVVHPRDSTGAGDTFWGTFLGWSLSGVELKTAVFRAQQAACRTVLQVGATRPLV